MNYTSLLSTTTLIKDFVLHKNEMDASMLKKAIHVFRNVVYLIVRYTVWARVKSRAGISCTLRQTGWCIPAASLDILRLVWMPRYVLERQETLRRTVVTRILDSEGWEKTPSWVVVEIWIASAKYAGTGGCRDHAWCFGGEIRNV